MTRARALKQAIRARAARTGERYTTARRHVLATTPQRIPTAAPAVPVRTKPRGGISESKLAEKTGHGLTHWFDVLDRFGAVKKGHTAAARHLHEAHGVEGWYAQGITVAYERARGVRAVNQRCDGAYEVSVSKVVAGTSATVVDALRNPRVRRALAAVDRDSAGSLIAALDAPASKGFVIRADGQGRFRYKWGETTVQFHLLPKAGEKVSVVVTNMKLRSEADVEAKRAAWRRVLNALAAAG